MKSKGTKIKKAVVHVILTEKKQLDNFDVVKKLVGTNVGTKAIEEVLVNYPQLVKKADALNFELQKLNREHEVLLMKVEQIKRGFDAVNNI